MPNKIISVLICLISTISLFSCGDETDPEVPTEYVLVVDNGTGGGKFEEGQQVTITANPAPDQEVFDKWAGDIDNIESVTAAETKITMPAKNISVTATYKVDPSQVVSANVVIDGAITHQTMDGFGFFGGRDVWWGSADPVHFYSEAWLEKIITELGITIWRNELYPHDPPTSNTTPNQDAHWDKQRPMVQALQAKAVEHGVDLKIILTAWSPPGSMKWNSWGYSWIGDENAQRGPGPSGEDFWPERGSATTDNNSGSLNPNKYQEFAQWWIDALQMYRDAGVDVYAISLQNEPAFKQSFNSAFYTTHWYADMIAQVVPKIKAQFPDVRIYGSEHMLINEGRDSDYPYFFHMALKNHPTAMDNIDILAVHGYQDGVNANSGSELAKYWTNHKEVFAVPENKKTWMTETSGYEDAWEGEGDKPGALGLAVDIQTALLFGDLSAWVFWQGSGLGGINGYNLMSDLQTGKRYHASRQFYRFVRPGAVRISASSSDESVSISAFNHVANGTQTYVLINTATEPKGIQLTINGQSNAPTQFEVFVTSATKNSESAGMVSADEIVIVPARSVVTLQSGGSVLGQN